MRIDFELNINQKMLISHEQINSLQILGLNTSELESFLQQEYIENPAIEYSGSSASYSSSVRYKDGFKNDILDEDYSTQLINFIKEQLPLKEYSLKQLELIVFFIMNLDENGFYTLDIEETVRLSGYSKEIVEECLEKLRELEPVGIFAKDLNMCLIKQLEKLEIRDEILFDIIQNHLNDISVGKISVISRKYDISTTQVRKYILIIQSLNPKPIGNLSNKKIDYIIPDVIIKKDKSIIINDNWIGDYTLNIYYENMIKTSSDNELKEYLKTKFNRAKFILNSIERRRDTIFNIVEKILYIQEDFFENKGTLKAMTLYDIAEELNLHYSTVSRAIKGKYLEYNGGVILIKDLFSRSINKKMDKNISSKTVKEIIKELIDSENKNKPYSDQKIAEIINSNNFSVSRRAVTKYRNELFIKDSYERKWL